MPQRNSITSEQLNNAENKGVVLVLTRYWPTALSVVRSLGAAGYTVDLAASAPEHGAADIAASSRYVRTFSETVCNNVKTGDDPALLDLLLGYDPCSDDERMPVLFPTDDYTASFADRHRDELSSKFLMPYVRGGGKGSITELMRKPIQSQLAKNAGLLCPEEWLISLEEEPVDIPGDMLYPCFVKPADSVSGFKGEMAKCRNEEELAEHLRFLRARNPYRNILVQKYLNIEGEIDIAGVSTPEGAIIPAIIRKTCVAQHERGVTAAGIIEPVQRIDSIIDSISEMLSKSGYTGMFDMEFNMAGDQLYFGELNFRSGGPNYSYYLSGVNLPDIAVKAIRGEHIDPEETQVSEYGLRFASEKVLWKEYTEGHMSRSEVIRILDATEGRLIEADNDRGPSELFHSELSRQIKRKNARKIRRNLSKIVRPVRTAIKMIADGYPQTNPKNAKLFSNRPRVLVTGRNYSSNLCMARSLGLAGYDVEILRIFSKKPPKGDASAGMIPDAYSKYVKRFRTCTLRNDSRRVRDALISMADKDHRMLLIPTEDVAAYIVDEHYDALKEYFIVPDAGKTGGEIIRLMSKTAQKELAFKSGLPMPGSHTVSIRNGSFDIPEDIGFPCFIKPDVSRQTSKKRMQKCSSIEELEVALGEIAESRSIDILIEDYVEIKRELAVLGLCCDEKIICPGVFETLECGHGSRRGVAVTGRSIPCEEISGLMPGIHRLMELTQYNGLFDIDLIEGTDGRLYFTELNFRYGASGYVLTRSGVNLPGMLADRAVAGAAIDAETHSDRIGLVFVSEKVLAEEIAEGDITSEKAEELMSAADIHFIKDEEDPKPYKHFRNVYGL